MIDQKIKISIIPAWNKKQFYENKGRYNDNRGIKLINKKYQMIDLHQFKHPIGQHKPAKIPRAKKGRSDFSIIF